MKKQLCFLLCLSLVSGFLRAQDVATLMAEGIKYEQQLKDTQAIVKYAAAFEMQPTNVKAALKCAEMNCSIGARQTYEPAKVQYFTKAKTFADAALRLAPGDADVNYIEAVVCGKLTEVEKSNEKVVDYVRDVKQFADKALTINSKHGKAWFVIGKWHYEMLTLNMFKKAAVKVLYGGLPKANIEDAISSFEKCKLLEPYFAINYLGLAKAYYYNKNFEKALVALQQCLKCPTLQAGDRAVKDEAKELLVKWQ